MECCFAVQQKRMLEGRRALSAGLLLVLLQLMPLFRTKNTNKILLERWFNE
jgi:hypothetical protein